MRQRRAQDFSHVPSIPQLPEKRPDIFRVWRPRRDGHQAMDFHSRQRIDLLPSPPATVPVCSQTWLLRQRCSLPAESAVLADFSAPCRSPAPAPGCPRSRSSRKAQQRRGICWIADARSCASANGRDRAGFWLSPPARGSLRKSSGRDRGRAPFQVAGSLTPASNVTESGDRPPAHRRPGSLLNAHQIRRQVHTRQNTNCGEEDKFVCMLPVPHEHLSRNCLIRRFISRPSNATETAEVGKPL